MLQALAPHGCYVDRTQGDMCPSASVSTTGSYRRNLILFLPRRPRASTTYTICPRWCPWRSSGACRCGLGLHAESRLLPRDRGRLSDPLLIGTAIALIALSRHS